MMCAKPCWRSTPPANWAPWSVAAATTPSRRLEGGRSVPGGGLHCTPHQRATRADPFTEGTPSGRPPRRRTAGRWHLLRLAPVAVVHRAPGTAGVYDRRRRRQPASRPGGGIRGPWRAPAICLSVPEGLPFDRYAVIPVARSFAAAARRQDDAPLQRPSCQPTPRRLHALEERRLRLLEMPSGSAAATPWTNREAPAARGGRPAGGSPRVRPRRVGDKHDPAAPPDHPGGDRWPSRRGKLHLGMSALYLSRRRPLYLRDERQIVTLLECRRLQMARAGVGSLIAHRVLQSKVLGLFPAVGAPAGSRVAGTPTPQPAAAESWPRSWLADAVTRSQPAQPLPRVRVT